MKCELFGGGWFSVTFRARSGWKGGPSGEDRVPFDVGTFDLEDSGVPRDVTGLVGRMYRPCRVG